MKTLKFILAFVFTTNCIGQEISLIPIIDISESRLSLTPPYYIQDTNGLLNPFSGTYIYTNGTTIFKIVLEKKENQFNGSYYEDLIIGEYQYIYNGVEKSNTLPSLNTVYSNQRVHNIDGNTVVNNNFRYWLCPSCAPTEKRLFGSIRDNTTNRYARIIIRRTTESGIEVIKIKILHVSGKAYNEADGQPEQFSLPVGEITLIKQP